MSLHIFVCSPTRLSFSSLPESVSALVRLGFHAPESASVGI